MNRKEYTRVTDEQIKGREAYTKMPLENGAGRIDVGTRVTITRKFKGFAIETPKCEHCGTQIKMTRVPPQDLDLIGGI